MVRQAHQPKYLKLRPVFKTCQVWAKKFFLVPTLRRWNPYVTLRVTPFFKMTKFILTNEGLL